MRPISVSVLLLSVALTILPACAKNPPPAAEKKAPALATEDDKTLYALGTVIGKNLEVFQLTPQELETVKAGFTDSAAGKPSAVNIEEYGPKIQELHRVRSAKLAEKDKSEGTAYIAKAAGEQGATKTASGLVITTLTPGTGAAPLATDQVKVNYEGKLINGTVFDSSIQRGEPATFPLNGVIPCWTEALQLMKVGGKARVVCPSELAYGERGAPPSIKPGSTLVFEVELLDIIKEGKEAKAGK